MLKHIFRFFLVLFLIVTSSILKAQVERKTSLNIYGGIAFYPKTKINQADLPTRALGGFNPSPLIGIGAYYRLSKRLSLGENYMLLFAAKSGNRSLSSHTFKTTLKFHILPTKKIRPYIIGGININLVSLSRNYKEYNFIPDPSTSNVIGNGLQVDSIFYREQKLKLGNMPIFGGSIGAGFEFKISKKFDFFAEYSLHENFGRDNKLMEQYYFYNQSNFVFHTVTTGLTMKLYKPQKQLLAKLNRDDWKNSKPIDVRGTIIYKNPLKTYKKVLPVEKTDTLETVFEINPTDERALVFFSKNIEPGEYQFMLPKKHRKIIRADLQILNYNKIEIEDDELELEMVEDEGSENILSRDANFAVLLREGFQHDIELNTTAENIMGNFIPTDTSCHIRITLRDQYDSIIAYVDTLESKKFNFVNVEPGKYKISFQRMNNNCKNTAFKYGFTGSAPYIKRQSNTNEPIDTVASYSINGKVSTSDSKPLAPVGTMVKLIDPTGRVETKNTLGGTKTNFEFKNLNSPAYSAAYEDPTDKASMGYKVKDRQSKIIREITQNPVKKTTKGSILVNGKVELPNPEQAKTTTALLIDASGKVKQKIPVNADGTFSFLNLEKDKYKVAYESTDPLVRGKLVYNIIDKSFKINKITLPELSVTIERIDTIHFSKNSPSLVNPTTSENKDSINTLVVKENPNLVTDTISDKNVIVVKKQLKTKEIPIRYPFTEFKPGTTYNDLGFEIKPEGYGIQVASFFINSNLEKFCQRVKAKGEKNIYVQVIQKDKNNPAAGIIYRVIIGADKDKDKMIKKVPVYMDKGYDAVLRKHLDQTLPY